MSRRLAWLISALVLAACVLAWAAARQIQVRARADALAAQIRAQGVIEQLARLEQSTSDPGQLARVADSSITDLVSQALEAADLSARHLRSVQPRGEQRGADGRNRTSVSIHLDDCSLDEVGIWLQAFRRQALGWHISSISLTPQTRGQGQGRMDLRLSCLGPGQ
jgi:hypothetical protein